MRSSKISRKTKETSVDLSISLDGSGAGDITTGQPFLDHMLDLFARHGLFDLTVRAQGDLEVDSPHTVEDVGISLGQAVRSAAFIVPGGYGVQEGGYMLIGAFYGLPAETGLALSLIKRVREIILGIPGLLDWQIFEGKRLWPGKAVATPSENGH